MIWSRTASLTVGNDRRPTPETKVGVYLACLLVLLYFPIRVRASTGGDSPASLANASLEDLMNTTVTTASKTEQKLSRVASAIFVITADDIARSGATSIPDLLRMVPGMDVAQITASAWAISARGLNGRFANELFVMVDGLSVYTQTTGGVFWDVLDLPLQDIDRIEVTRGPGGSVWGVNAVNGVVNIITKKAAETKGGRVVAGGGNLDQGFGTLQYGGTLAHNTDYRIYTKYFNQTPMIGLMGGDGGDGWRIARAGFRTDTSISPKSTLMVEGDLYSGSEGAPATFLTSVTSPPVTANLFEQVDGGSLNSLWDHRSSDSFDTTVQVSFDRYRRLDFLRETRNTVDVDFQQHLATSGRHDLLWGAGLSTSFSDSQGSFFLSLNPNENNTQFFNVFVQDQVTLIPYRLYVTGGAKLDHNSYTDFNVLPSVRVAWTPNSNNTFWAAISDAVRTPADTDRSDVVNLSESPGSNGTPVLFRLLGNPHFADEAATIYEAGYRAAIASRLSFDFASYFNSYRNQGTTEPETPFMEKFPAPPHLVIPLTYENLMHGEAHGIEIDLNTKITSRWALSPGYAFEQIHMHTSPASQDTTTAPETEGASPRNSAQFHSHLNIAGRVGWDASAYFVGRLSSPSVPSYTRVDTQLRWGLAEHLTVSLVGQNLLKNEHLEFIDTTNSVNSTLMKRSGYLKLEWGF